MGEKIHTRDNSPLLWVSLPYWAKSELKGCSRRSSWKWKKRKTMSNSGRQRPSIICTFTSHFRGVDYFRVHSHKASMPCPSFFDPQSPAYVTPASYCELWPCWSTDMLHNLHMMYYQRSHWSWLSFNSNAGKEFTPVQRRCECAESAD